MRERLEHLELGDRIRLGPPSDSGTFSAKSPDSASARTVAGGKVRSRSASSAPAATTSRMACTAASRCARLARRSVGNTALIESPGSRGAAIP